MVKIKALYLDETPDNISSIALTLYKAIAECPFEKNKDISGWAESGILVSLLKRQYLVPENVRVNRRSLVVETSTWAYPKDSIILDRFLIVQFVTEEVETGKTDFYLFRIEVDY